MESNGACRLAAAARRGHPDSMEETV
jgi:hypothetical protein